MIFTKDLSIRELISNHAPYDLVKHVNDVDNVEGSVGYVKGEKRTSESSDTIARWEKWLITHGYAEKDSFYKFKHSDKIKIDDLNFNLIFVQVSPNVLKLFLDYDMTNRYIDVEIIQNKSYTYDEFCDLLSIKTFKIM